MTGEQFNLPVHFPCFLCGDLVDLRIDKKKHPYWICDACGIQAFIRKRIGIAKLESINSDPEIYRFLDAGDCVRNSEILRLKARIELIKTEINNSDDLISDLFVNTPEKNKYIKRLKSKLKVLETEYQHKLIN